MTISLLPEDPRNNPDLERDNESSQFRLTMYLLATLCALAGLLIFLTQAGEHVFGVIAAAVVLVGSLVLYVSAVTDGLITQVDHYRYELRVAEVNRDRLQRQLHDARQIDEVSGCFNSNHLESQCNRLIALNRRSGLQFVLVVFRVDQYLHTLSSEGSVGARELLSLCGAAFQRSVREVDVVARVNEDVFAMLLCDSDIDGALIVTERIMGLLRQIRLRNDENECVTISGGIAADHTGADVATLLANATSAMDVAEREGFDRIAVYVPGADPSSLLDVG